MLARISHLFSWGTQDHTNLPISVLARLTQKHIQTDNDFNALFKTSPFDIERGIKHLDTANILTQEILNEIIKFSKLNNQFALNDRYTIEHTALGFNRLADGLAKLKAAGILNEKNRKALLSNYCRNDLLAALHAENMLTQEIFDFVIQNKENVDLSRAMICLHKKGLLSDLIHLEAINELTEPAIAAIIIEMHQGSLLDQKNYVTLLKLKDASPLLDALTLLNAAKLSTQANFDKLIKAITCTPSIGSAIHCLFSSALFYNEQNNFDILMEKFSDPNYSKDAKQIIDLLVKLKSYSYLSQKNFYALMNNLSCFKKINNAFNAIINYKLPFIDEFDKLIENAERYDLTKLVKAFNELHQAGIFAKVKYQPILINHFQDTNVQLAAEWFNYLRFHGLLTESNVDNLLKNAKYMVYIDKILNQCDISPSTFETLINHADQTPRISEELEKTSEHSQLTIAAMMNKLELEKNPGSPATLFRLFHVDPTKYNEVDTRMTNENQRILP